MNRISGIVKTNFKKGYRPRFSLIILFVAGCFVWNNSSRSFAQNLVSGESISEKGAICELDEQEFIVKGKNSAVLRVHRIFHIYNREGRKYGRVHRQLHKFAKLDNIKAQVKDLEGRLIKKLEKDDIKEESLFSDYVLYADRRVKSFDLTTTAFPYILEYSYEVKYKSLFFWPAWFPQMEIPVKRSVYTLTVPKDFTFKMHNCHLEIQPIEKQSKGKRQLVFELTEVPPFESERNMPPEIDYEMCVLFAAEEFDLDGYKGSANSWGLFGKWYASLAHKQYKISPKQQDMIEGEIKNCPSPKEKVKALYQFLQRKTRYVAVELDIGGYKPRDAESTLATGYGDCKDLGTLFIAMLGIAGIEAHPALIRTQSEGRVLADFPSNQFNHIIACVPTEKDTLWLDCICNWCPFGELPWRDEGCQVLVVMEDTSTLVKTPISCAEENRIVRSLHARLDPDGSMEITGTLTATGNYESSYREFLNSFTAIEKREWLGRKIGRYAPNHTLLSYNFEKIPNLDVPFTIGFGAKLIKYPIKSGGELLINLNLLTRVDDEDILKEKERKYPVDNQYAFTQEDEVTLDLPENLEIKALPNDQDMVFPFGSFHTQFEVKGNQLTYKRIETITQKLIEPKDYEKFKGFLEKTYLADDSFVVLKKTE